MAPSGVAPQSIPRTKRRYGVKVHEGLLAVQSDIPFSGTESEIDGVLVFVPSVLPLLEGFVGFVRLEDVGRAIDFTVVLETVLPVFGEFPSAPQDLRLC